MTIVENVVLVDENDKETGVMEKLKAHQRGLLHRAFSVFLFNEQGEMLLQRRALGKYHSPGLWTNACCSHPRPAEATEEAAERRLREEMGITCIIEKKFSFIYRTEFENGLTEHELDHVFIGRYEGEIAADPDEVAEWKYLPMDKIRDELIRVPEQYTYWFRLAFPMIESNK